MGGGDPVCERVGAPVDASTTRPTRWRAHGAAVDGGHDRRGRGRPAAARGGRVDVQGQGAQAGGGGAGSEARRAAAWSCSSTSTTCGAGPCSSTRRRRRASSGTRCRCSAGLSSRATRTTTARPPTVHKPRGRRHADTVHRQQYSKCARSAATTGPDRRPPAAVPSRPAMAKAIGGACGGRAKGAEPPAARRLGGQSRARAMTGSSKVPPPLTRLGSPVSACSPLAQALHRGPESAHRAPTCTDQRRTPHHCV